MKKEVVITPASIGVITTVEVATITMAITTRLDIKQTMDNTVTKARKTLAKWCASVAGRRDTTQVTVPRGAMTLTNQSRKILVKWSVSCVSKPDIMQATAQKGKM